MFNKEDVEILKAENEKLQSQLEVEILKNRQLVEQFNHKRNELLDLVAQTFLSFRKITEIAEIAERNDYNNPQQKISQIKEFAEEQKNYYAQLTMDTTISRKNRTNITNQSNK